MQELFHQVLHACPENAARLACRFRVRKHTLPFLAGYSHLVALIRGYNGSMGLGDAVGRAIDECIADGILVDYLRDRRAEVFETILTQWDEEKDMEIIRRDAVEEGYDMGLAQGREEGRAEAIARLRELGVSEDIVQALQEPDDK